jgi:hypothetical protein
VRNDWQQETHVLDDLPPGNLCPNPPEERIFP